MEVLQDREDNYILPLYWQHGNHLEEIPEQMQRIYDCGVRAVCVWNHGPIRFLWCWLVAGFGLYSGGGSQTGK